MTEDEGRAYLDQLFNDQRLEDIRLDYKEQLGKGAEMVKDLSAFANTEGGDYIIGVVEAKEAGTNNKLGYPGELRGIPENLEAVRAAIETAITTSVNPRLPLAEYVEVPGYPQGSIYIIRIPKTRTFPHLFVEGSRSSLYKRAAGQNYPLDVKDMRQAIIHGNTLSELMNQWIAERININKSISNLSGIHQHEPRVIIHFFSADSFENDIFISPQDVKNNRQFLRPLDYDVTANFANVDGYVRSYSHEQPERTGLNRASLIISRKGQLETVTNFPNGKEEVGGQPIHKVWLKYLAELLKSQIVSASPVFKAWNLAPPYYACVTLLDCDYSYLPDVWKEMYYGPKHQFGRGVITSPIVELTGNADDELQVVKDTRPIIEYLTQCGGVMEASFYDQYGQIDRG